MRIKTKHTFEELVAFGMDCDVDVEIEWEYDEPDPSVGWRGGWDAIGWKAEKLTVYNLVGDEVNTPVLGHTRYEILDFLTAELAELVSEMPEDDAFEEAEAKYGDC